MIENDSTTEHTDSLYQDYKDYINSSYPLFLQRYGIDFPSDQANGAIITDKNGKTFIDCVSGYGIYNIGHNHPTLLKDLILHLQQHQLHTKPLITPIQVECAKTLSAIAPGDLQCSFLCNSGSEAIDTAIKLARLTTHKKEIITTEKAYHGFTYGALSASGISSFKKSFEPIVPDIIQVPYGEINALKKTISSNTAAFILEPIQHEAGIIVPPTGYLKNVKRICETHNVMLILDEIKTGMGKTGAMFACEHEDVIPDILVIGKSLGGGLIPVGAVLARKELWKRFSLHFSMSASTYAGNTLACQAAISTIKILQEESLIHSCEQKGKKLFTGLKNLEKIYSDYITEVTGKGLLLGVRFASSKIAFQIIKNMIDAGVLVLPCYGDSSMMMIEPSLVITEEEIQTIITQLHNAMEQLKTR